MINRDNNHIKHLSDPRKCSATPSGVRQQALIYLAGKNGHVPIIPIQLLGCAVVDVLKAGKQRQQANQL